MRKQEKQERNWALVAIASAIMLFNVILLVFAAMNIPSFGWWSLALAAGAVSSIILSIVAIKRNEPAWLLLDLILPG